MIEASSHRCSRLPHRVAIDGASRNDLKLLGPTLKDIDREGQLCDIETLHLDLGYHYTRIRAQLADPGLTDLNV